MEALDSGTKIDKNLKFVFEVSEKAKNICIANIANIFLILKKYDLAIMHLVESEISLEKEKINNVRDNETTPLNNSSISKNKKKLKKAFGYILFR